MAIPLTKNGQLATTGDLSPDGVRQLMGVNEFLTDAGEASTTGDFSELNTTSVTDAMDSISNGGGGSGGGGPGDDIPLIGGSIGTFMILGIAALGLLVVMD